MRLYTFLQEAVIKPDLKWLGSLIPKILTLSCRKSKILNRLFPASVIKELNELFVDRFIEFKLTTRQSSDNDLGAAGISYAEIETKEPFKIIIYLDDVSIFKESDQDIKEYWIEGIYKILGHELIHRQQFSKMKITKNAAGFKNFKEYYSDSHELMTLAHDILLYMLSIGFSKIEMKNELQSLHNIKEFESFNAFIQFFKSTDKEYKQLFKYIYQYIDKLKD